MLAQGNAPTNLVVAFHIVSGAIAAVYGQSAGRDKDVEKEPDALKEQ